MTTQSENQTKSNAKIEGVTVEKKLEGKFLHYYHVTTEVDGKSHGPYEMVSRRSTKGNDKLVLEGNDRSDAVVVVAITDEQKLVCIREYRYPIGQWIWGLPAGCLGPNQTVFQCAQTELQQECGMIVMPEDVRRIRNKTLISPGMTDETISMVWCRAAGVPNNNSLEEGELIETHLLGLDDLRKLLDSDEWISNRLAVIADMYILMHDHMQNMRLLAE